MLRSHFFPALMAVAAMTLTGVATLRGASPSFRDQIRAADVPALRVRLTGATSPNEVDDTGATPLMYAAAVGSIDTMRTILEAGADVNVAGGDGMTALMWATGDLAKVRLLVEHGANVNAKANDGTTTALVAAAQRGALGRGAVPARSQGRSHGRGRRGRCAVSGGIRHPQRRGAPCPRDRRPETAPLWTDRPRARARRLRRRRPHRSLSRRRRRSEPGDPDGHGENAGPRLRRDGHGTGNSRQTAGPRRRSQPAPARVGRRR